MSRTTLFEVSWEVCNKVGGIYAVVSSKALEAAALFGDNYYLLGPDLGNNAEFEETDEACWQELRAITTRRNLACRFGRWDIPGRPKVILVGYRDRFNQGQLLFSLWNRYGIDSISGGWDYVEPVMFSTACGEVIEAACQTLAVPASGPVLAHFHEWMCGGGLLYLKERAQARHGLYDARDHARPVDGGVRVRHLQADEPDQPQKWKPGPTTSPPNARWKRRRRGKPIALPR
ncbi:MAG: hypothetical protein ACLSTO_01475 [Bilophila wadsworthia]